LLWAKEKKRSYRYNCHHKNSGEGAGGWAHCKNGREAEKKMGGAKPNWVTTDLGITKNGGFGRSPTGRKRDRQKSGNAARVTLPRQKNTRSLGSEKR